MSLGADGTLWAISGVWTVTVNPVVHRNVSLRYSQGPFLQDLVTGTALWLDADTLTGPDSLLQKWIRLDALGRGHF